jgi:hypothetical protein
VYPQSYANVGERARLSKTALRIDEMVFSIGLFRLEPRSRNFERCSASGSAENSELRQQMAKYRRERPAGRKASAARRIEALFTIPETES